MGQILKTRYDANEIAKNLDFIHGETREIENLSTLLEYLLKPSSKDVIVTGGTVRERAAPSMNVDVDPILAFIRSSGKFVHAGSTLGPVSIVDGGAQDRLDTLEVRYTETTYDIQQRAYKDPATGNIGYQDFATKARYEMEAQVIQGTEGAGVAPNHTVGWIKLAEILVSAGETTSILDADIENCTGGKDGETTANWTTETSATFRLESLSNIKTKLRLKHKEDGDHVDDVIQGQHVDWGTGASQVDADLLPLGTAVTSSPTGGTATNLLATSLVRAALQEIFNRLINLSGVNDDGVKKRHIDFGTGAGQVSAVDIPIADAGGIITATEVENALQELAGAAGVSIKRTGQTIDAGVSVKDCVYYDTGISKWKTAGKTNLSLPHGVYVGSNTVILFGYVSGLSGLTAGKVYWMKIDGSLTDNYGEAYQATKVGFSLSTTELLIDIDIEAIFRSLVSLYGFVAGGVPSNNVIDYIDMTLLVGNAIDRGDMSYGNVRWWGGNVSGLQYGFYGGHESGLYKEIEYIDKNILTGNAASRGDLSYGRYECGGVSGPTYGFWGGGHPNASPSNNIDYIDTSLIVGNAIDRGDLIVARKGIAGVSGPTYGFYGGGFTTIQANEIEYIDLALTVGNAIDRGDLTVVRYSLAGIYGLQYGFYCGGSGSVMENVIDYIDMTLTTGNAIDRGNLTLARNGLAGVSGPQYGFCCGGINGGVVNIIDYIDMSLLTGNAADRGDSTLARYGVAGVP